MSPFAYLWRSIRPRVTNSGSLQVCTGTTGHAEACKFEYDPEKLDFGDMASFDFISTVCYKHALQVSHVDLTDSGVLACAYTKLKAMAGHRSPTNSWAILSMHWGNHSASNRACGEPSSHGVCRWSTFTGSMIPRLPTGRAMTGAHNTGAPSSTMMMIRSV